MFHLWKNRNFSKLLAAQLVSGIGDWSTAIVIPVLLYETTGNTTATALLMLSRFVPALLMNWVLRIPLLKTTSTVTMMRAVDLIRMILFPFFIFASDQWHFYLLTFTIYLCATITRPCCLTTVKMCCDSADLSYANNLLSGSQNVIMLISPILGSVAYNYIGPGFVLGFNSFTFLASFLILGKIQIHRDTRHKTAHPHPNNGQSFRQDIRRICEKYPWIVFLVMIDAISGFAFGALNTIIPVRVQVDLDNSAYIYSVLISCLTLGMLLGNFVFHRWFLRANTSRTYLAATAIALLAFLLSGTFALAPAIGTCLTIVGLANSLQDVSLSTTVQVSIENNRDVLTVFTISESLAAGAVVLSSSLLAAMLKSTTVSAITLITFSLATLGSLAYGAYHKLKDQGGAR